MSVSAAERKKDYHAGPHNSFPVGPSGEHLRAAWDLAGHATDPEAVRAHIRAFARMHGLEHLLPQTAQAKKAQGSDVSGLFNLAYHHSAMDDWNKRDLIRYAEERHLTHHLPEEAHGLMHEMGVQHNHPDTKNDEAGFHTHTVVKAFNPIAVEGVIVKSWIDGENAYLEGWLSTPRKDLEKDVTEPEAFIAGMDGYFARRAPLSLDHGTKRLPVGHLQKAAVVREGRVLKATQHPSDYAEFEYFPGSGTGVWARAVVNVADGVDAVRKGNVGGFSFIANAPLTEPLPGGRYRYLKLDPWIESTIAAYPINPDAVIAVAKAFGLTPPIDEVQAMPLSLEEIMKEAAKEVEAQRQAEAAHSVTKADLGAVLTEFKTSLLAEVEASVKKAVEGSVEEVKKALPSVRGEGVGRKGGPSDPHAEPTLDDDPLAYIVKKAGKAESSADFTPTELGLLNHVLHEALVGDLRD